MTDKKREPERYPGRKNYPTDEVAPEDFLSNEEVQEMLESKEKLKQEDVKKLLNCVHCNECGTSEERIQLNAKFIQDGNEIEGLSTMLENFKTYKTPYETDKMRSSKELREQVPRSSDTLYFMGCLSTIRIPKFTNNSLKFLLKHGVDFTILEKEVCCGYPILVSGYTEEFNELRDLNVKIFKDGNFKEIICLCPACYYVFKEHYPDMGIKFSYISDHLKPTDEKKNGSVSVQHLCQLMNRGRPEVSKRVNEILETSGYKVEDVPHWCCGGGLGYMHRTDVIDKIAEIRLKDFKGDYYTTYCPSCYWILKIFGQKLKISPKLRDVFALLL